MPNNTGSKDFQSSAKLQNLQKNFLIFAKRFLMVCKTFSNGLQNFLFSVLKLMSFCFFFFYFFQFLNLLQLLPS